MGGIADAIKDYLNGKTNRISAGVVNVTLNQGTSKSKIIIKIEEYDSTEIIECCIDSKQFLIETVNAAESYYNKIIILLRNFKMTLEKFSDLLEEFGYVEEGPYAPEMIREKFLVNEELYDNLRQIQQKRLQEEFEYELSRLFECKELISKQGRKSYQEP